MLDARPYIFNSLGYVLRSNVRATHTLRRRANDLEFSRWDFFPGGIFTMRRNTSFNVPQIPCSACLRPVPQVAYPEGTLASDRLVALSSRCKGHE